MQEIQINELATPHDHTAANARREGREVYAVRVRANHSGQVLPDGRMYGPGEHVIQIYKSDAVNLLNLLETKEHLVEAAREMHEEKERRYYAEDGKPGTYSGTPQAEFQMLALRSMLPLTECRKVGELEPIAVEAKRRDEEMRRDVNRQGAAAGFTIDDVQRMIGEAVGKAISAERERVAATASKAGK